MRDAYEDFVQRGIDQWFQENEGKPLPVIDSSAPFWQPRSSKVTAGEMPRPAVESDGK